jgi:hypothetical protein
MELHGLRSSLQVVLEHLVLDQSPYHKTVHILAGGATGKLATSFDGNAWIQRVSSFGTSNINGVFIDNDTALAVGAAGKLAYSV